jgi:hypothetical protein
MERSRCVAIEMFGWNCGALVGLSERAGLRRQTAAASVTAGGEAAGSSYNFFTREMD